MDHRPRERVPVLADVARVAGVSVPTVSRVLTGATPVSDKTRKRVDDAILELGYRPNEAARALVRGRQSMVGIIAGNTTRFGYAATIQGIEEAARAAGLLVAITVVNSATEADVKAAVDLMLGQPLAGVIVLDFDLQGERALSALPETLPIAVVTSTNDGRAARRVLFDDHKGGYEATKYLLSLGHETVHYVAVPSSGRPSGRLVGWREALLEAGRKVPEVVLADWSAQSGFEAGLILAGLSDVTAVLSGNDEIAFGVMKALQLNGLSVPDDVSVVGFDDHPHAVLWSPSLTTMAQDFVQLGASALHLLVAEREGADGPADASSPSPHLIVRDSTAPPRAGGAGRTIH
ncbi:LacI family DNA-binding transcriptional regulator [Subtercola vilae]|uniref:LacI family transcriptional regulator n=1 Tax=Subtercola vilae TaxID=2056433 RepID=A0A4T2BT75_9MICO|nr:LacI family DNA-binding transcriptional regulator [Subtercola vilae]TIH34855.1 LacI family transcriptional regulator [Subtercola vilae]